MNFLNIKKLTFVFVSTVILIGCGGGSSDSTTTSSNTDGTTTTTSTNSDGTTTTVKKTKDIKLLSAVALNPSDAVISNTDKIQGKDELKLKITIKNVGTETIIAESNFLYFTVKTINYDDSSTRNSAKYDVGTAKSIKPNEEKSFQLNTGILLKNTSKSYTITYNDQTFATVKHDENNYDNNSVIISNIIFNDVDIELIATNTLFYTESPAPTQVHDNHVHIPANKYGHQFEIKNNSGFIFYGDLILNLVGTPYTSNGENDFNLIVNDYELINGATKTPGGATTQTSVTPNTYNVTFKVVDNYNDSLTSNNTQAKTIITK